MKVALPADAEPAVAAPDEVTPVLPETPSLRKPASLRRMPSKPLLELQKIVKLREAHKFDMTQLPRDIQRVANALTERYGEEYALHVVFTIRTAEELHRAWHMTLLTSKLMEQLRTSFGLRMSWELGVLRLKFRIEDGDYELHRKVPYDYDSEYQDKYMRVATALIQGNIEIHHALTYQTDIELGKHTAASGRFLRDHPGRLLLYPLVAATCAVIFFGGDWCTRPLANDLSRWAAFSHRLCVAGGTGRWPPSAAWSRGSSSGARPTRARPAR